MTHNEYLKIVLKRGCFFKKSLLLMLSSFVPLDKISHNQVDKVFIIPCHVIYSLDGNVVNHFSVLISKFSLYNIVSDGKLYIRYAF